jgi:hypothetical protein
MFMSDLLFSGGHPYLADGDPDQVKLILAQVRELQARTFVPGHGTVGQTRHLDWMDEYINTLNTLVSNAIENGATEAETDKIAIPKEYQHLIFPTFFQSNIKFLYNRQMNSRAGLAKKG